MILQRALCGNYVNFGVFSLYGDMALSNALGVALKMALSLPLEEMLVCIQNSIAGRTLTLGSLSPKWRRRISLY